jgi:hypothetical protein
MCDAGAEDAALSLALLGESADDFIASAKKVSELVRAIPNVHEGVVRTFFRDYVEQIARWAVGPEDTPLFIYKCLGGGHIH